MENEPSGALRADLTKSTTDVASMFDRVAERYDLMDALMTGGMDHVWMVALRNAVKPAPGERRFVGSLGEGRGGGCGLRPVRRHDRGWSPASPRH